MLYSDWPVDNHRYKNFVTSTGSFSNCWRDDYMQKLSAFGIYDINKNYSWEYK